MNSNQVKAGAILNYAIIFLRIAVYLLYTPYMLRMLGKSEFGLYSLALSIMAYLEILDFGFSDAIVRYTAKYRAQGDTEKQYNLFGMFFSIYIVLMLIVVAICAAIYFNLNLFFSESLTGGEIGELKIMMLIIMVNLAFAFPMSIFGGIITAYENFVFLKSVVIARTILNTLAIVAMLHLGYKAVAILLITTIFNISVFTLNYFYCKRKIKIRLKFGKFDTDLLREIFIFSFWIFLNLIMDRIYWNSGPFILGIYASAAAIAVFALAIQFQNMYMQFSTAISSVFLPKITALVAVENDERKISDIFIKTGRIQFAVLAFIMSGFVCFGRNFIELWVGNSFDSAYYTALIFFSALTVPLIQNIGITILQARNQMKFRSLLYLCIATASVFLQAILTKYYGEIGCAWAIASALVVGQVIIMNIYYYRVQHLDIPAFWREIAKMSLCPIFIVCGTICIMSNFRIDSWTDLGAAIALFSCVYIPAFYFTSANAYEKSLFANTICKILKRRR